MSLTKNCYSMTAGSPHWKISMAAYHYTQQDSGAFHRICDQQGAKDR